MASDFMLPLRDDGPGKNESTSWCFRYAAQNSMSAKAPFRITYQINLTVPLQTGTFDSFLTIATRSKNMYP